jgi:hypothetical protein
MKIEACPVPQDGQVEFLETLCLGGKGNPCPSTLVFHRRVVCIRIDV